METYLSYILVGWFVLAYFARGLEKVWPYIYPKKRCSHGVAIWPGKNGAYRCEQCHSEREAERAHGEEVESRKREQLRIKYAEDIRQLTYLQQMDPFEFEKLVSHAYRILGWEVEETPATGDGGVDAFLRKDGTTIVLQCKRLSSGRVGTPILRDLLGTITAEGAQGGILATTSSFSEDAIAWAKKYDIELLDGKAVVDLLARAYPSGSLFPNRSSPAGDIRSSCHPVAPCVARKPSGSGGHTAHFMAAPDSRVAAGLCLCLELDIVLLDRKPIYLGRHLQFNRRIDQRLIGDN